MRALITGASSGIGEALAKVLKENGYSLVLVGRNEERLNNIKNQLGDNVEIISLDLSIKENAISLYNQYKDIDLLINNAGFGDCAYFNDSDLNKDINMIETNIVALHILTKLYLREMIDKNKGYILNVASIAGFLPGPLMATYYATKNYVVRLSEGIKEELKHLKSKVKISVLCPGPVNTNFSNTANVKFSLKGVSKEYVANYTWKCLKKQKFYILPTFKIKMCRFLAKVAPTCLTSKIVFKLQKSKI